MTVGLGGSLMTVPCGWDRLGCPPHPLRAQGRPQFTADSAFSEQAVLLLENIYAY